GAARLAAGHFRLQGGDRGRCAHGDARGRRRPADGQAQDAGDRDRRSALERAALRLAAQYHEGEEEADRRQDRRRLRGRYQAAARRPQNHRAARAQSRRQGQDRRRTPRQAEERGGSDLMPTLLLAEHDDKSLKDATGKALTVAKALGADVHILVAGYHCQPAADAAAKLDGVKKVLLADAPAYAHRLAEPIAALIVSLAGPYETIMAAATTTGKNIMPRVAALLDVMQISEIIKVVAPDTFERPIYAGNAIQIVRSTDPKKVITVRTATFQATGEGGAAPVEPVAAAADPGMSSFVGEELSKSERPELTSDRKSTRLN